MKIAYFTNQYPKVSHSFIRREIIALEKAGIEIKRFAIRTDDAQLTDPEDLRELSKTAFLLSQSKSTILKSLLLSVLTIPVPFFRTLLLSFKFGLRSERGVLNHLFYFIEANIFKMLLNKASAEHVHVHFGTNPAMVAMLCFKLGGPSYSFTVHGPEEFDKPRFIHLPEKIEQARFVVAISSYGRSQLYRLVHHQYWDKIKLVHCGLDKEFYLDIETSVNNSQKFVCIGRLCEQKGQLLLVQAFSRVVSIFPEAYLTLAGDGEMRDEIEQLIFSLDLSRNVNITGWISSAEVKSLILESRAMILASFAEGLPVVIMEAMSLARPVLSTYIAGIPELVCDRENGFLFPAGDIDQIQRSIIRCLELTDRELATVGEKARHSVLQHHSIETESHKLLEHFSSIVKHHPVS